MSCADLRNDYAAWALGIAEDPEREEIAAHLARQCPECRKGVADAVAATACIAAGVKVQKPPARLRARVLAMVDRSKSNSLIWAILPWGLVAALSVIVLAISIPAQRQSTHVEKLADALAIINDPRTKDVTFGGRPQDAKGRMFVSGSGIVLIGSNLPKLDQGKVFEVWVMPATGKPASAGTFVSDNDSTVFYVYTGSTLGAASIAVTLEPENGSPQPTTKPVIDSKL